jgi:hypothetical protein
MGQAQRPGVYGRCLPRRLPGVVFPVGRGAGDAVESAGSAAGQMPRALHSDGRTATGQFRPQKSAIGTLFLLNFDRNSLETLPRRTLHLFASYATHHLIHQLLARHQHRPDVCMLFAYSMGSRVEENASCPDQLRHRGTGVARTTVGYRASRSVCETIQLPTTNESNLKFGLSLQAADVSIVSIRARTLPPQARSGIFSSLSNAVGA